MDMETNILLSDILKRLDRIETQLTELDERTKEIGKIKSQVAYIGAYITPLKSRIQEIFGE